MTNLNRNTGLGVDWQPGAQSGLIANRGSDMLHEFGVACPSCRTEDVYAGFRNDGKDRRRSATCNSCHDGWLYRDPLVVRGLIVGIRQQKNILDAGLSQPGDASFSPDPDLVSSCGSGSYRIIGQNDKLTALWSQPLDDGQTIIRGAATMAENAQYDTGLSDSEDRLWYEPEISLWCEDEYGRLYEQGSDFELGPGKILNWIGDQPEIGTKYVIKYTAFHEWIVWQSPQERRDRDNRDLGPLIFIRKRHVAFINSSPKITSDDRISLKDKCG